VERAATLKANGSAYVKAGVWGMGIFCCLLGLAYKSNIGTLHLVDVGIVLVANIQSLFHGVYDVFITLQR
jgi:hypothetical protein